MLNVAHRGASGVAPEHTFPAYDRALAAGADYLEQDVHMTRDGVLVVLHDATVDRTTEGTGFVRDMTLAELRTLDAGSWFNESHPLRADRSFVGLRIPTLDEVFARYGGRARYYVETKDPELYPGMEEELLRLIAAHGLRDAAVESRHVIIQSFLPESLQRIRRLDPALPTVRLYPPLGGPVIEATLEETATYAVGIGPARRDVDPRLVRSAHDLSLTVHAYTVDGIGDMAALRAAGVDGLFTNFPDRLALLGAALLEDEARLEHAVHPPREAAVG